MISQPAVLRDALLVAHEKAMDLHEGVGLVGYGIAVVYDRLGDIKSVSPFTNLVTDAGDLYYASKAIVGIAPASPSAPTAVNGMKLGTGSTAVAKAGAGGALVTYLAGSNVAFDATFPQTANLGTTLGVNAVYKTTWAAGVATSASIAEVVIVNDQATNATSTAANSISRGLITANKGASDSLAVTWNHKFLGA